MKKKKTKNTKNKKDNKRKKKKKGKYHINMNKLKNKINILK